MDLEPGRRFLTGGLVPAIAFLLLFFTVPVQAEEIHVGPDHKLEGLFEVPWHDLTAGDTLVIHWRPKPYKSKIVISVQGTADRPFTVRGEPGPNGELPVLDGANAITPPSIKSWSEDRGVICLSETKIPNRPPPTHIVIENLDITGAHPDHHFLGSDGFLRYGESASAIFVESGEHITIRNCILRNSANGFFSAYQSSDVLVEACSVHSNGLVGSDRKHNAYSASNGMTYQFCRFGPPARGSRGDSLKDRSAGLIVRYNWFDGGNRQLDLVEAEDSDDLVNNPRYRKTFVYGNVLIERAGDGNSQMIHYGGDSGEEDIYRKGILYLVNNTFISHRRDKTTLLRLSTRDETAQIRNNVIFTTGDGTTLALMDDDGIATLADNWITSGWIESRSGGDWVGRVIAEHNVEGLDPGFVDFESEDFHPAVGSPLIDAGRKVTIGGGRDLPIDWEFAAPRGARRRPAQGPLDLGALEARK